MSISDEILIHLLEIYRIFLKHMQNMLGLIRVVCRVIFSGIILTYFLKKYATFFPVVVDEFRLFYVQYQPIAHDNID